MPLNPERISHRIAPWSSKVLLRTIRAHTGVEDSELSSARHSDASTGFPDPH